MTCPVCKSDLVTTYTDMFESIESENISVCPSGCYGEEYSYGAERMYVGDIASGNYVEFGGVRVYSQPVDEETAEAIAVASSIYRTSKVFPILKPIQVSIFWFWRMRIRMKDYIKRSERKR